MRRASDPSFALPKSKKTRYSLGPGWASPLRVWADPATPPAAERATATKPARRRVAIKPVPPLRLRGVDCLGHLNPDQARYKSGIAPQRLPSPALSPPPPLSDMC